MRWSLALAAIVAMVLFAAPATAASVQIAPVEGPPVTLDLDQMPLPPDVNGQVYTLRSEAGERQVTVSGYSLAALLEAAGVDPVLIGYLEIGRPAGGSLLLSRRQATTPGAFQEGPPVVFRDDLGLHLLRPNAGESDLNEADLISLPAGAALNVQARSGTLVKVRAKTSNRRLKVGQQSAFTAILDRTAAGEDVEISWYFDDGASAEGAEVKHRFRQPGLYDVVVGVTTPGDRVGASATVTVRVGEPTRQGPNRRGGGDNRDKNAPDSGASEGGSGSESGQPSNGSPTPSFTPEPAYTPTPTPTPTPDPGYSPPPPAPEQPPVPPKPPEPPEKRQEPKPRAPKGDEISGQLLADADIAEKPLAAITPESATKESRPQPVAARTGSTDPVGEGGGIPGAAVGIGAALAMLGLGGLLEARGIGRLRW